MPTFDAASSAGGSGTVSSISVSHTASGSDRYASIALSVWSDSTLAATYGGVSATSVRKVTQDAANSRRVLNMFGLVAPATGAQTVEGTLSAATFDVALTVVTYTDVDQTTPRGTDVGASNPDGSPSTTPSVDAASASGELVVDAVRTFNSTTTITVGAGQTSRVEREAFSGNGPSVGASDEPGAASVTMSWTADAACNWAIIAVPLLAAAAPEPEPEPELTQRPAGRSKKPRRRLLVEINGQDFAVSSAEEAQVLLAQAKQITERAIEKARSAPVRVARGIQRPRITTTAPELKQIVAHARQDITSLFDGLARDLEIAALMRKQFEEEEEDLIRILM